MPDPLNAEQRRRIYAYDTRYEELPDLQAAEEEEEMAECRE